MNLDRYTYGKTPAAIFLADRLNQLGDPVLARKVGKNISTMQSLVAELYKSNIAGTLSAHTIGNIAGIYRKQTLEVHDKMVASNDELVINLMTNVMIGDIKRIQRQVMDARHAEQYRARVLGKPSRYFDARDGDQQILTAAEHAIVAEMRNGRVRGAKILVEDMHDPITPEILVERSKRKLVKRGKSSDLY